MIFRKIATILVISTATALAGGDSAPSSHMVYNDANFEGDILINEVRVPKGGEAMYTYYGYWVRSGKTGEWTHMVTMDVAAKDSYLRGGNDSFIEDWLATGKELRTTHLRKGWKRKPDGEWHAFGRARYSVNSWDLTEGKRSFNFKTNWDGGVAKDATGEFYYMKSGGANTKPTAENPSTHSIKRTEGKPGYKPIRVSLAKVNAAEGGKVTVTWEIDPKGAPQFSFKLAAYATAKANGGRRELAAIEKSEPHIRSVELELPAGTDRESVALVLVCRDIFDNDSKPIAVE